ncbi:MAG TPA: amidohydrolase [Cytophagales bacterium]|nr:amidohydrolase [Cytophagales bacterium]
MEGHLKVAAVQMDIYWLDIDANLAELEEYFHVHVVGQAYDIVLLPEMFNTGFGKQAAQHSEFMNGRTHKWLRNMAALCNALLMGSISMKEAGVTTNRLLAVYPDGSTCWYDKRHLFTYGQENDVFAPGSKSININYKGFRIKPLICYDLRFPEWSRNDKSDPFDLLLYVANWPNTRQYAWEQLLIARAIENQCYVIGCNRVGKDGNSLEYMGGSLIINYEGKIMAYGDPATHLVHSEIDKDELDAFRRRFPFLNDADQMGIYL